MTDDQAVLFAEQSGAGGDLGVITLNRPQALNALNHTMILALDQQIAAWSTAAHIKAIVIQAVAGKAFCAGGDVRAIYQAGCAKDPRAVDFFRDEYRLIRRIFHCPKPYIALLDGITMGGGVGISTHGSHRVATENLVWAMPETSIGLFPDVGGSYFLSRLPAHIGFYLGLTGARINCHDGKAIGLVTQVIQTGAAEDLLQALRAAIFHDPHASVNQVLQQFAKPLETSPLCQQQVVIEQCFAKNSMEDIIDALQQVGDAWCQKTIHILQTKSPTSLKVTLHQLQEGAKLQQFDACMQMEFRLAHRFLAGHDFFEGVRAVVIDKDQAPVWVPNTLAAVKLSDVLAYFAPLKEEFA